LSTDGFAAYLKQAAKDAGGMTWWRIEPNDTASFIWSRERPDGEWYPTILQARLAFMGYTTTQARADLERNTPIPWD
jgi:hypothetical protein